MKVRWQVTRFVRYLGRHSANWRYVPSANLQKVAQREAAKRPGRKLSQGRYIFRRLGNLAALDLRQPDGLGNAE
jgi:hypothetical protein